MVTTAVHLAKNDCVPPNLKGEHTTKVTRGITEGKETKKNKAEYRYA